MTDINESQEHEAHAAAVTKLRISFDDQYLFSASEDGVIYVFKIADKDEHTLKRDKAPIFSDEVYTALWKFTPSNHIFLFSIRF